MTLPATSSVVRVKPMEPTELWTFKNVLSLLDSNPADHIVEGLEDFLLNNRDVFLTALPFKGSNTLKSEVKEILLRKILYTNITSKQYQDAVELSKSLGIDDREILRCISQTSKRYPEKILNVNSTLKSKIPDDRVSTLNSERISLYKKRILRERRIVLQIVLCLLKLSKDDHTSLVVRNLGKEILSSSKYLKEILEAIFETYQILVDCQFDDLEKNSSSTKYDDSVLLIIDFLKITVEIFKQVNVSNETILDWFQFMNKSNFFLNLGPVIQDKEIFFLIQGLVTMNSVLLLDISNNTTDQILKENSSSYLNSASVVKQINSTITDSNNVNSTIMYTWLIILSRKKMILEEYHQLPSTKKFIQEFPIQELSKSMNFLSLQSTKLNVFDDLYTLSNLLKFDTTFPAILTSIVIASMPYITLTPRITSRISDILKNAPPEFVEEFFNDEDVQRNIILARAKFPLSFNPFLKLASINGGFALKEISNMKSYMALFDKKEIEAITTIDYDNTDLVRLTKFIDVFPPYEINNKLSLLLSENTKAKLLPSTNPNQVLVAFLYDYNGWAFLGRILQNVTKSFNSSDTEKTEIIVDILQLLSRVIDCMPPNDVSDLLSTISLYIDDSDVVEVIFRLFEQGLHTRNIDVLCCVLKLINSLVNVIPTRIWIYLSKSVLFESNGHEDYASVIYGAIEMINSDFSFSLELINLVDALLKQCFGNDQRNKSLVLTKFVNHLLKIFESFIHCHFNNSQKKCEIGCSILKVFNNILSMVYGIDQAAKPQDKITNVLADSAKLILNAFASNGNDSRLISPLLVTLDLNYKYEYLSCNGQAFNLWFNQVFEFSTLIIDIRSMNDLKPSRLEWVLFEKLPVLAEIYALHESRRVQVLNLLTSLMRAKWEDNETPSILSYLTPDYARVLLSSLAIDLENPFDSDILKVGLYKFISAVMGSKHKGLSMLFIDENKILKIKDSQQKKPSVLRILKSNVKDMKYYPNHVSIELIDAISIALNAWSLDVEYKEDDKSFIEILLEKFKSDYNVTVKATSEYIPKSLELKLLSKITKVLSILLYASNDEKSINLIIDTLQSDDFRVQLLRRCDILGYNKSLFETLEENCQEKLGITIDRFAFSDLSFHEDQFIYNFQIMKEMYQENEFWPEIEDLIHAFNNNIIWTSAQIDVVRFHGALLSAFCSRYGHKLTSDWVSVASQLLFYNVIVDIPYETYPEIFRERSELAFFILERISNNKQVKIKSDDVFEVIKFVSELINSKNINIINSIITANDGIYKPLLRILHIAFDMIKNDTSILVQHSSIFLEIFDLIIAKGIKSLLIELQNEVYLTRTNKNYKVKDIESKFDNLTQILSILKVFVQLKVPVSVHEDMAMIIRDHGTIKSLLNLYTSSHMLIVKEELLFAGLSLVLIQELSVINCIAREFISSGLYMVLAGSSVSNQIRLGNVGVNQSPQHYLLWINGLLPLALTSFDNLGEEILPEIVLFLKAFSKQIESCIGNWAKDQSSIQISTAFVSETRQIIQFYFLLRNLQQQNPSLFNFNQGIDMDLIPGLENEAAREEFVENIKNLLKHPKFLSLRVIASTAEEQRIIETAGRVHDNFIRTLIDEIRSLVELF